MSKNKFLIIVTAFFIALICSLVFLNRIKNDPSIALLIPENKAQWILFDEPADIVVRNESKTETFFRKKIEVDQSPDKRPVLSLKALKLVTIYIDDKIIYGPENNLENWKNYRKIDLAHLASGQHELVVSVSNQYGPVALLAYSEGLGLYSGRDWEASQDGIEWKPTVTAEDLKTVSYSRKFPRADKVFFSQLPVFIPLFFIVFLLTIVSYSSFSPGFLRKLSFTPNLFRLALFLAWGVLAFNNFKKVPFDIGFDFSAHLDYIKYVAYNKSIPLATEGWQMFQSPLYYLISAPVYLLLEKSVDFENLIRILKIIPFIFGAAQVELSYRAMNYVFPERKDLQVIGVVIGGLIPMNFYISQALGNEPVAGFFSASVVVMCFMMLRTTTESALRKQFVITAILLGLALLSKVTALLLIFPVCLSFLWSLPKRDLRAVSISMAQFTGIVLLVSGWYYLRNWIELGTPFIGGWDPSRGIVWWQYPGYRTIEQFYIFGEALFYPFYSLNGFWNTVYSTLWADGFLSEIWLPPWNFDFMISGVLWSLLPSIGMVLGVWLVFANKNSALRKAMLFSACLIGLYFLAMGYMYLKLPIYSTVKATYTTGLIPCYSVLAVGGLSFFLRGPFFRGVVYGGLACWAFSVYVSFFVF